MDLEQSFKRISTKKIKSLSIEQRKEYYENLRKYYLSLPYDENERIKKEKHFLQVAKVLVTTIDVLYQPKFVGFETPIDRIDGKGLIYVCNHLTSLDQFPIISAIGKDKPLIILAKDTLLKLKRGRIYQYVGCEFVNEKDIKSQITVLRRLSQSILRGKDVLIFPEGTRNSTAEYMLSFKGGPTTIAQETGTKIIPCAINENYKLFKKNNLYVRRGHELIVTPDDDRELANEKLEEAVRTLIWENMIDERRFIITSIDESIKEAAMKQLIKKQKKLEKQRKKIN